MSKNLIQTTKVSDSNVVLVLPPNGYVDHVPYKVQVWFNVPVRNVSVASSISDTIIPKEAITIEQLTYPKYQHYLSDADRFPNSITDTIYAVSFDYYFTTNAMAILTLSYEKYVTTTTYNEDRIPQEAEPVSETSEWVEDECQVHVNCEIYNHEFNFDLGLGVSDESYT